jgi:protein gp37
MLRSFDGTKWQRNQSDYLNRCEGFNERNSRCIQCNARRRKHTRALPGNHRLAAIVALIGRVAGHRTAALHTLLVLGHRGQTVRKLQRKERSQRQDQECHPANHLVKL